jgi:alkanesulfonate monooxygenase SsuD/methylene tetrahydromethanopterin reductase-like flavin-dependent oxidoreductase (luciferase family)
LRELLDSPYGIALPQGIVHPSVSADEIGAYAAAAEASGFGSLWVSELTSVPTLDPLLTLAAAATTTSKVKLGVAVLLPALRQPLVLAREVATLDRLSGGRLLVGVGFGSNPDLFPRFGLSPERRLRRYLDCLELMERLWSGDPVSDRTAWWDVEEVVSVPTLQRPRPPLLIGARRGKALERAARRGDGWVISGSAPPDEYRPAVGQVQAALESAGRPRDRFTIAKRVYIAIGDRESELARARDWFGTHYGRPELADAVAVVGDPDECLAALADLRGLGIDHLILNPMFDEREQLELLAARVLRRLPPPATN